MALEDSTRFFELDQMRSLLSQEWSVVREGASRIPSGAALSLAPSPAFGERGLCSHPAIVHLHLGPGSVCGDLRCQPDALPIDSDSIQLLVARHVFDVLDLDSGIAEELARVLAPGGTLFLFGLNMLSPWRLWSAIHTRREVSKPRIRSLVQVRQLFANASLHAVRREFLGGAWPTADNAARMGRGGHLDGAWVLVLSKQRSGVRPIPLRRRSKPIAMGHGLAEMPSGRACL